VPSATCRPLNSDFRRSRPPVATNLPRPSAGKACLPTQDLTFSVVGELPRNTPSTATPWRPARKLSLLAAHGSSTRASVALSRLRANAPCTQNAFSWFDPQPCDCSRWSIPHCSCRVFPSHTRSPESSRACRVKANRRAALSLPLFFSAAGFSSNVDQSIRGFERCFSPTSATSPRNEHPSVRSISA